MNKERLIISPKTKVFQLIETYPQLEAILIEYIPVFSKLKNPILRKTVAKVTTLQQAASIGKVKVEDLINHLRKEVGQDFISGVLENEYNTIKPKWFNPDLITEEFDARDMLAAGEHPVNQVISDLNKLEAGKIYRLITSFLPAPLIDKATSLSFDNWISEEETNIFHVYFIKT